MSKLKRSKGKIKNATAVTYKTIKFKSKLELFMFKELEKAGFKADYEGRTYDVLDAFTFNGEKIRAIKYTPDFVLRNYPVIIETKGYPNESFPLRIKLFKKWCSINAPDTKLFIPHNQKECLEVIATLNRLYHENKSLEKGVEAGKTGD